jgi:hypothetical protein
LIAVSKPSFAAGSGNGSGIDFRLGIVLSCRCQLSVAKAYCDCAGGTTHEVLGRVPPQKSRPVGFGVIREEGERKLQGVDGTVTGGEHPL